MSISFVVMKGKDEKTGEFVSYIVRKCDSVNCSNPAYIAMMWEDQQYKCVGCARWLIKLGRAMGYAIPEKTARIMERHEIIMSDDPVEQTRDSLSEADKQLRLFEALWLNEYTEEE